MLKSWPLAPVNVTLFGSSHLTDIIKWMRPYRSGRGSKSNMTVGLIRREQTQTERRQPCKSRQRHRCSYAATKQGMSRATRSWKGKEGSLSKASAGAWPSWHFDFGFLASSTDRISSCCFKQSKSVIISYSSPRKEIQ